MAVKLIALWILAALCASAQVSTESIRDLLRPNKHAEAERAARQLLAQAGAQPAGCPLRANNNCAGLRGKSVHPFYWVGFVAVE